MQKARTKEVAAPHEGLEIAARIDGQLWRIVISKDVVGTEAQGPSRTITMSPGASIGQIHEVVRLLRAAHTESEAAHEQ